ncbi:histidine acid phosphatase [Cooperia oncophora]
MKQHMNLGKLLRKIYIEDMNFLSARYSSKEIYVRSTDRNRTIISAMSNILGMYGQRSGCAISDVDYPAEDGWPAGFVPVAIHTVNDDTDYVLNPDADCDRQIKLWNMAKSSPELQAFLNRPDVASLLSNLTEYCGEPVDVDNLWIIRDALLTEQIHANDTLRAVNKWFSDELFNQMTAVNDQVQAYQNGLFSEYSLNMKYHQNEENATLYPITHFIGPCEGQLFCELDIFGTFANRTKPEQPMVEWCNVDPLLQVSCSSKWTLLSIGI